jgi:hypothetical protein
MEIPEWHRTTYQPHEVVGLVDVSKLQGAPEYAALRSYATGRREHALYGPMPAPVARIANRRLWLLAEIREWLTCPIPQWRRSEQTVALWIDQGRPRTAATMPGDDGPSTPTP